MLQRTLIAGVTREEIIEALVALGEDPTVSRVEAVRERVDPLAALGGDRSVLVRAVVSSVRSQLDSDSALVPVSSGAAKPAIANAIAALELGASSGGELDLATFNAALLQLRELRDSILAYDRRLNEQEVAPTGDDYNELFGLFGLRVPGALLNVGGPSSQASLTEAARHFMREVPSSPSMDL